MEFMHNYNKEAVSNRQHSLDLNTYDCVMVIGVGGIGNWAAFNLALTGKVEHLIIVDPDDIECSNLNRTAFRVCDVGAMKVWALKYLILERRPDQKITTFEDIFKIEQLSKMKIGDQYNPERVCIIDCRDDIFEDIHEIPNDIKLWKIGYDGLEITIDGDPRNTKVWGVSHGYTAVPSFVCSAQLAANIVVNHILMPDVYNPELDCIGGTGSKFNSTLTYHTGELIPDMYRLVSQTQQQTQLKETESCQVSENLTEN